MQTSVYHGDPEAPIGHGKLTCTVDSYADLQLFVEPSSQELHESMEQPGRWRAHSGRFSACFSYSDCSS